VLLRRDGHVPILANAIRFVRFEAIAYLLWDPGGGGEVKAEFDLGVDLVDVLSAGSGGTREGYRESIFGDGYSIGNDPLGGGEIATSRCCWLSFGRWFVGSVGPCWFEFAIIIIASLFLS